MSLEMFAPTPVSAAPAANQQPAPQQQAPIEQPDVNLDAGIGQEVDQQHGRTIEDRARDMGWVDQAEFKGDPTKWRSADQFVQRAYDEPKIAQSMLAKLESRLEEREREFDRRVRGLERMQSTALTRQRDAILAQYDQAMRDAAAVSDLDKFDKLQAAKAIAARDHNLSIAESRWSDEPVQPQKRPQSKMSSADNMAVSQWLEQNQWATRDPELGAIAETYSNVIARQHPGLDANQHLAEVSRRVKQRYPEKFGVRQQNGNGVPSVEGGSRIPSGNGGGLFSKLPREAQAEAMRAVKAGSYKNVNDWATVYFEGERA